MEQKKSAAHYIATVRKILVDEAECIDGKPCYFDDSLCPAYEDGICRKDRLIDVIKGLRYEGA